MNRSMFVYVFVCVNRHSAHCVVGPTLHTTVFVEKERRTGSCGDDAGMGQDMLKLVFSNIILKISTKKRGNRKEIEKREMKKGGERRRNIPVEMKGGFSPSRYDVSLSL